MPRTVSSRRRASSIGRSAPSWRRCATTAARSTVPARASSTPARRQSHTGTSRQAAAVGGTRIVRGAGPGAGRAVLQHQPSPRRLGVQPDHLLLEDRRDERLEHVARPRDPQRRPAAVGLADHRVQRRVEPARVVARAQQVGDVGQRTLGARTPRGGVDPVAAHGQVAGGGTVRRRRRLPDRPVRGEPPRRVAAAAPQRTERQPDVDAVARTVDGRADPPARRSARWSRHHYAPHRRHTGPMTIRTGISGWRYAPWRTVFYPAGAAAAPRARVRVPAAHVDRDQRLVLRAPEAGELRRVGRRDARRLRVLGQGPALRDAHEEARRRAGAGRQLLRQRRARARAEAGTRPVAAAAEPRVPPGPARRVLRPPAAHHGRRRPAGHRARRAPRRPGVDHDRRRPAPAARAGGPARELRGPRPSSSCCGRTASVSSSPTPPGGGR